MNPPACGPESPLSDKLSQVDSVGQIHTLHSDEATERGIHVIEEHAVEVRPPDNFGPDAREHTELMPECPEDDLGFRIVPPARAPITAREFFSTLDEPDPILDDSVDDAAGLVLPPATKDPTFRCSADIDDLVDQFATLEEATRETRDQTEYVKTERVNTNSSMTTGDDESQTGAKFLDDVYSQINASDIFEDGLAGEVTTWLEQDVESSISVEELPVPYETQIPVDNIQRVSIHHRNTNAMECMPIEEPSNIADELFDPWNLEEGRFNIVEIHDSRVSRCYMSCQCPRRPGGDSGGQTCGSKEKQDDDAECRCGVRPLSQYIKISCGQDGMEPNSDQRSRRAMLNPSPVPMRQNSLVEGSVFSGLDEFRSLGNLYTSSV